MYYYVGRIYDNSYNTRTGVFLCQFWIQHSSGFLFGCYTKGSQYLSSWKIHPDYFRQPRKIFYYYIIFHSSPILWYYGTGYFTFKIFVIFLCRHPWRQIHTRNCNRMLPSEIGWERTYSTANFKITSWHTRTL